MLEPIEEILTRMGSYRGGTHELYKPVIRLEYYEHDEMAFIEVGRCKGMDDPVSYLASSGRHQGDDAIRLALADTEAKMRVSGAIHNRGVMWKQRVGYALTQPREAVKIVAEIEASAAAMREYIEDCAENAQRQERRDEARRLLDTHDAGKAMLERVRDAERVAQENHDDAQEIRALYAASNHEQDRVAMQQAREALEAVAHCVENRRCQDALADLDARLGSTGFPHPAEEEQAT